MYLLDARLDTQSISPCLQSIEDVDSSVDQMRFETQFGIWLMKFDFLDRERCSSKIYFSIWVFFFFSLTAMREVGYGCPTDVSC